MIVLRGVSVKITVFVCLNQCSSLVIAPLSVLVITGESVSEHFHSVCVPSRLCCLLGCVNNVAFHLTTHQIIKNLVTTEILQ